MQFEEIRLKHFQQFLEPRTISGLQPHLNIICGSNESGKSTLIAALKAAIFERYSSRPLQERYRPFGASVSPEVGLRFVHDGVTYDLHKVFSSKKDGEVVLAEVAGRGKWTDHEAEEKVAEMFGNEIASRGESKPENQGIHGLLWVDQTRSYLNVAPASRAHDTLQGALDEEVMEMLGGEHGQSLLQRIKALRDEHLTDTGKAKGDYKKHSEVVSKLQQKCEQLRAELTSYEAQVDELGRTQRQLDQYRQDATLQNVESAIRRLEKQWQAIEGLQRHIDQQKSALQLAQARLENSAAKKQAREQRAAAVDDAAKMLTEAQARLAEVVSKVEPLVKAFAASEKKLQEARQAAQRLAAALELQECHQKATHVGEELRALTERHKQALQLQQQIIRDSGCLQAINIDAEQVRALQAMETEIRISEARLDSVATRIDLDLQPEKELSIGERTLGGTQSVLITESTAMLMPGLGSCVIHPGGEEIKALRQELGDRQQSLVSGLERAGVDSVDAAASQLKRSQDMQAEKKSAEKTLQALAPKGVAVLEARRSELTAEYDNLHKKLDGRKPEESLAGEDTALERQRNADAIASLEQSVRLGRTELEEARNAKIEAAALLEGREAVLRNAGELLQREREQLSDDELVQQWRATAKEAEVIEAALADSAQELAGAKPEDIRAELERQQQARTTISADIQALTNRSAELRAVLVSLGQRGLADELADAEVALAQQQREQQQLERKVGGLDLLYRTLNNASQQARQAVAQPLINAMQPYLATLMPGTFPVIDENFQLTGVQRDGEEEPFERLSIGTREQLAVLVRLAYADMLSEKGQPLTLVLDDALVNADDERRDRMKTILHRAAKNYQIILLTCQPRHYHDAGGHMISLD